MRWKFPDAAPRPVFPVVKWTFLEARQEPRQRGRREIFARSVKLRSGGFRPLFIERHSLGDSRDSHLSPSDLPNVILGDGSNIGAAFGRKCTVALPPRRDVNIGKEKPIQIPSRRTNTAHLPINTFYSVRVLYTNSW
ncbi:unnamed protein product [Tenebrio molitor]|nr:unnamed protein product [Tenebrio molitor]